MYMCGFIHLWYILLKSYYADEPTGPSVFGKSSE